MTKKTSDDYDREENYRFFRLGDDLRLLASSPSLHGNALWSVLRFFHDTALYFRTRVEQVSYAFSADQELLERAIAAASSDKLGECLSILYRIRELRKETLESVETLLEKHRKCALEGKSSDEDEV